MGVVIQLEDKNKFKSPFLYIHCDEQEALNFIENWKQNLINWASQKRGGGLPLERLEASVAMVDLVHKLGNYYLDTIHDRIRMEGKIQSWLRLELEPFEDPTVIKLY